MGLKWKSQKWDENWFKFNGMSYISERAAGVDGHACACARGGCGIDPWLCVCMREFAGFIFQCKGSQNGAVLGRHTPAVARRCWGVSPATRPSSLVAVW